MTDGYAWYSGSNDEYYTHGPCGTRGEAINELCGEEGYVVEAKVSALRFYAERLIEDQYYESEEYNCHEYVDNGRVGRKEEIDEADKELQEVLDQWANKWHHTFVVTRFVHERNEDYVNYD